METQPLWAFATELYADKSVETACLHLQDEYGVAVSVALWCLWLDHYSISLEREQFDQVLSDALFWHDRIIVNLRRARRSMKYDPTLAQFRDEALRESIKATELNAEKRLLNRLQIITQDNGQWVKKPQGYLKHYLARLNVSQDDKDIKTIVEALKTKSPQK